MTILLQIIAIKKIIQMNVWKLTNSNSSAMSFIICQNIHYAQKIYKLAGKLFMSGVRPIEMIVQLAFSEQAPTDKLYNHFCMAELLQK